MQIKIQNKGNHTKITQILMYKFSQGTLLPDMKASALRCSYSEYKYTVCGKGNAKTNKFSVTIQSHGPPGNTQYGLVYQFSQRVFAGIDHVHQHSDSYM